jgi:hypothetical protein
MYGKFEEKKNTNGNVLKNTDSQIFQPQYESNKRKEKFLIHIIK